MHICDPTVRHTVHPLGTGRYSYSKGRNGYRYFDPTTQKLYLSCHVVFREHIPLFSIQSSIHDLTRSEIIRIDPFSEDSNNLSSHVPSTSNTPSHVLPPFPLHHTQRVVANSSASTNTLLSRTLEAPSFPMVSKAPSEIVSLQNHQILPILVIFHLLLHF